MKLRLRTAAAVMLAGLLLAGCDQKGSDAKHIKVGVINGAEQDVAEVAKKVAKEKYGLDVELVGFSGSLLPNESTNAGDLDANVFQHRPFLEQDNKAHNYRLVAVGNTFVFPMAGYSRKIKSVAELKDGATIAIPNDPTNLGRALLPVVDAIAATDVAVVELSSFQLETTSSLRAAAATILNVTEDHMDRYPLGLQQYRAAKLRVYENARACIANADDALTMPVRGADDRCISFGVDVGDYHLNRQQGETWLRVKGEKVLNVKEMKISGQHNYSNALAALALADAAGLPRASSLKALTTFTGLAHRFQLVLEHNGVRWINDSKATNVGSTEAALNGLHLDGTLYLLLGGDGKSADFTPLSRYLTGDNVRLYCFGRDGAQLAALRPDVAVQTETMEQAMRQIAPKVVAGDMVLLSPACASLDQFKNFEQRGDIFARLAKELG